MAETLFSLTSSANKRDLVRRLLLLALLSAVALVFTWTKATAQNVSSAVIASFSEDFAPGSPGPGWSYLWNANGLLGDSANYEAMQWIGGAQYAGGAGIPNVTNFTFGIVETNLVHPGLGAAQGEVTNRYAVARYTVANDGTYFLVNSSATLLDNSCSDGVEIVVFTNDSPVANTLVTGASRAIFDLTLGALVAGDIVDVAIGPNGNSDCDLTIVDWEISFLPATTPGSEVTYIFESAPSGLRIDFNDASQATPFGVLLPVGGNLDIAAPNQQLYAFDSWSNGGEIAQRLTVGNTDETLIATFLDLAASGGSIVAGYSDDWSNGPAPPAGWAYLWNSTSVLGDAAGYSALQWNGTQYAATAPSGLPNAYRFSWNNVTADLVSPGPGIQQGESTDRYEITRYTASQTGMYYLVNSSLSILSSTCSNGVDIVVLRNDEPLATVANEPGARQPFDLTLGYLAVGDSVDVAVGPNGDSACDTSVIDWELFLIPGLPGNTPPELRAFESESVAEGNSLTVPLSASDADGDGLTFTLPDPPEFASLTDNDDGTGSIALNPAPGDAGTYALTVTVTDDGSPAASDTETLTVTVTGTAATPVMTPAGGVFEGPVQVSLSTATSGATICYTLDGTDPDEASLEYSGTPVPISVDAKLKAKAFKAGLNASGIASADFLFEPLPSAGLVGHWSLDEGSGTLAGDSSSNNNDGNLGSNAAWERTGYLGGNALTVNGTADSHVRVADDLSLRFAAGDDYTVSFWVRINAYPGTWQTMLWRGDDAARYAFFVTPDNKLLFTSGANNAIRSSVELASGSWQHVMAVQEAGHPSRKRRLYINGVEVASSPTAQPADGLGDLFIGSRRADSYEAFAGDLDEVRIYNRALLDEEVLTLSGRSVPSAGMAGRWSLDEGSGAVAGDSSTNNNDGTLGSNAAWEGTGYLGGNALTVDATADSHVRVADDASLRFATSDDYTVSFWVRINAYPGTWQTMLWRGDDAARYAFFVTPDNKLLF
ncbi:MAG: chitobiase/beta-hexosaminidase C-terminal domain-containing protein, partial [Chromatiales bacterium]